MNFIFKTVIQLGSRLGVLVCGLLLTRWLISNLSSIDYYNYSQITDLLTAMILILITFSVPTLALRLYSREDFRNDSKRIGEFWSTMLVVRIASYFIGLILLIAGLYIIGQSKNIVLAILLYSAQFLLIADSIYKSITDATARSYTYGITDLAGKIAIILGLFGFNLIFPNLFTREMNLYFFSFVLFGGYLLSLMLDAFWNKFYTKLTYPNFGILKTELKSILYFTGIGFLSFLYISSFTYFLNLYNVDVISYNSYITAFFKIFSTTATFGLILMPSVAVHFVQAYNAKNKPSIKKAIIKYLAVFFGIYLLMAIAIPIITFLIDPSQKYPQTSQYAFWLLPLAGIYITNSFINNITTLLHQERWDFWITVILFVVNLIAQITLVSRFGVLGTVISFYIVLLLDFILKGLLLRFALRRLDKI